MANEFTLADYERTATPITAAVIRTWREASPILEDLSFKTSDQLVEKIKRFNEIPEVPWRKVGAAFTDLKVEPEDQEERLYFMGAKIDVPYEYVKANSLVDVRAAQEEAIMKGVAYKFNESFFLGSPAVDVDGLVGLHYRLINDFLAEQSIDAGALDISPDTAVASWQHKLFDVIDETLDVVDGNPADKVIFMGKKTYRRAQSAMRSSNLLDTTTDQLGRQFITYGKGGPKIVEIGRKVDQTTQIMPDTELANGTALTGSTKSSLFVVRFGEPYVAGWCQEEPFADDVGLLENRTHYRTVVRGSAGLYINHPRAIGRAYNLQSA